MKSYLSFAWKEIRTQRVASVLLVIAVVMSTTMTAVAGQAVGILQSMRIKQAAGLNGNRYATFYQITEEQAEKLHTDSRLYDVGNIIHIGSAELGESGLDIFLQEYHDNALAMYPNVGRVKEGRLPEHEMEIALPEEALPYFNCSGNIGETVTIPLSVGLMDGSVPPYEYSADFVLSAVLENDYMGYPTGLAGIAVVGNGTASMLLPEEFMLYRTDFKTDAKADFQEIVEDIADTMGIDRRNIQYNWILLDALGISYDGKEESDTGSGFSFMMFACVLVGGLVLLAAGLVIYNILKISVTKRIGEYGILRAIGSERRQIYRLVLRQLIFLCGIGIPVGLLLGVLSVRGILTAAAGILNPDIFMMNQGEDVKTAIASASFRSAWEMAALLALSAAVTLLFAMLAALPAARYASRVAPTVAISGQPVTIRRRVRKNKKIRNFEAYYARLNIMRGGGRSVITILSLVMSITVFVTLQSFTGILNAGKAIESLHIGDYALSNTTRGISEDAAAKIREYELVENMQTAKLTKFEPEEELPFQTNLELYSYETLQVASVDENRLLNYLAGEDGRDAENPFMDSEGSTKADSEALLDEFLAGTACLIKNPIPFSYGGEELPHTNLAVGDTVSIGDFRMRVAGIMDAPVTVGNDGYTNGVQILCADSVYDAIIGNNCYAELYPALKEGADADAFEEWVSEWCSALPGTSWLSYRQYDAQLAESYEQIRVLCFVLITFIGIIGMLNIINTVYHNIHTRMAEITMQRAIGMSMGSLYRTFLWEGAYYGLAGSAVGGIAGYVCSVFVQAAVSGTLQVIAVPVGTICEAVFIAVAACLLATAVPLGGIGGRMLPRASA